jgi:nucleotide-binding universal stress UspA family protein
MTGLVVIGYDGSADARDAVAFAAAALRADTALVVNVWQTALATAPAITHPGAPLPPTREEERQFELAARRIAEEGAALARDAGLSADPEVRGGAGVGEIAAALNDVAAQRGADLLVVGRRGMSRLRAALLGSVADAAVRDGRHPVLVVSSRAD